MTASAWGMVLTIAGLAAIAWHVHRWRSGRIPLLQLVAGVIARGGFVLLGLMYATDVADRWHRAPVYGLAIVGVGIVLNLAAGIIENIRRNR